VRITGEATSVPEKKRQSDSNCSKDKAKVSVHVYDSDGKLAEEPDGWEKGHFAGAHVIPKATGSYFIIVSVEESPEDRTHWALVYGFR